MVAKIGANDAGKMTITFNWSLFITIISLIFSGVMFIVVTIVNINKNVENITNFQTKTVDRHTVEIKELQLHDIEQDKLINHSDNEIDWHIESHKSKQ